MPPSTCLPSRQLVMHLQAGTSHATKRAKSRSRHLQKEPKKYWNKARIELASLLDFFRSSGGRQGIFLIIY